MRRLLVGMCVLAVAVVSLRAADEKKPEKKQSVKEAVESLLKELGPKYTGAKTQKERDALLTAAADQMIDLANKSPEDPTSLQALQFVGRLRLPDVKDGPKTRAAAALKTFIDNKKVPVKSRVAALTSYLAAQEQVIAADADAKSVDAAKKEIAKYRKLIKTEFKGKMKDLYVGAKMPELTCKNLDDKEVKLSDYKDKVVVLDIWATWCPPCRAMIPHEREMVKKLKNKPFALISVSADSTKDDLTKFLKDNEMPWTQWYNGPTGGVVGELGVTYFPTIYILDTKGVIRFKDVRGEAMDKAVEKLLAETEASKKKAS
jgi:thiol-disulfide isomerase/thioredoxin